MNHAIQLHGAPKDRLQEIANFLHEAGFPEEFHMIVPVPHHANPVMLTFELDGKSINETVMTFHQIRFEYSVNLDTLNFIKVLKDEFQARNLPGDEDGNLYDEVDEVLSQQNLTVYAEIGKEVEKVYAAC